MPSASRSCRVTAWSASKENRNASSKPGRSSRRSATSIAANTNRSPRARWPKCIEATQRAADPGPFDNIELREGNRVVRPRSDGQNRYLKALQDHELVFCVGPAGTGKTYLAVAMAVSALRRGKIKKIVLVRPAVEAGEHLGFLPGDLEAKINPYLRPLLDALHDLMDYEQIRRYIGNDLIEIAPLAYMRGRTLNDAIIILDEGQNATIPQMKMFLTRMGQNARIVVTGDVTQVDLPPRRVGAAWRMRSTVSGSFPAWVRSFLTRRTSCGTPWCRRSSMHMRVLSR